MEKPDQVEEERSSINERQMENLDQAAEERRSSSNKRQYAQWKMETLSAQVPIAYILSTDVRPELSRERLCEDSEANEGLWLSEYIQA